MAIDPTFCDANLALVFTLLEKRSGAAACICHTIASAGGSLCVGCLLLWLYNHYPSLCCPHAQNALLLLFTQRMLIDFVLLVQSQLIKL